MLSNIKYLSTSARGRGAGGAIFTDVITPTPPTGRVRFGSIQLVPFARCHDDCCRGPGCDKMVRNFHTEASPHVEISYAILQPGSWAPLLWS